jgi:histone-lysine N-methyltransferase SETMAR
MNSFEIRVLLRHYWKKGLSARATAAEICKVEGEGTIGKTTAIKWFKRFEDGDFDFEDKPRSGRPCVLDEEDLRAALEDEPSSSTRDLADKLGVAQQTVVNYLHKFDFVHKKPRPDSHELTDAQAIRRVEVCRQLLDNPLDDHFWKRIVTCDEKWFFLVNRDRSKSWVPRDQNPPPVACQDRFGKKVMLCVWWNVDDVVHFELVPDGRAVNAELYSEQLERVYNVLRQRYPTFIRRKPALLQHDNGPAHRANLTKKKLVLHPAYSPNLAPSDYGLFRSMVHFLRGRRFETFDQVEAACREFFESKEPHWYRDQIRQLAERWRKVIENDGLYFEE